MFETVPFHFIIGWILLKNYETFNMQLSSIHKMSFLLPFHFIIGWILLIQLKNSMQLSSIHKMSFLLPFHFVIGRILLYSWWITELSIHTELSIFMHHATLQTQTMPNILHSYIWNTHFYARCQTTLQKLDIP